MFGIPAKLFSALIQIIKERLRALNVDVKAQYFTINENS